MSTLDYLLITAALGLAIGAAPYLHRMYIVHTAVNRVETFFNLPCEETYIGAYDYCKRHQITRAELPPGYYPRIVRMEEAIHSLRHLGRPAIRVPVRSNDQDHGTAD